MSLGSMSTTSMHYLGTAFVRGALRFDVEDDALDLERLLRGEEIPASPVRLRVQSGSRMCDFMGDTSLKVKVVSDGFVAALRRAGLSGWSTYSVAARSRRGELLAGLHGLAVVGRSGLLDRSHSRVRPVPPASPTGRFTFAEVGLRVVRETWDGSDLFIPDDTYMICVSDRAAVALGHACLSNLRLLSLADYEIARHASDPSASPEAR